VDLSEGGYGVSLLNDCKYGHSVQDNVIRLSLLRSPTLPDPEADQGEHHFAYTLWPHAGGWEAGTVAAAYALNDPLIVFRANAMGSRGQAGPEASSGRGPSFVQCAAPNIVIETIKQAEDGRGIIVRFYESQRRRGPVTLTAGFPLQAAWQTNLIEADQTALTPDGNSVSLFVRPYQIVTLRLVPVRA
jgi:alpha-mannosidase